MSTKDKKNYTLEDVQTLVTAAVSILRSIGNEKERADNEHAAWMLEDTLNYIGQMKEDDGLKSSQVAIDYLESLEEDKIVNS